MTKSAFFCFLVSLKLVFKHPFYLLIPILILAVPQIFINGTLVFKYVNFAAAHNFSYSMYVAGILLILTAFVILILSVYFAYLFGADCFIKILNGNKPVVKDELSSIKSVAVKYIKLIFCIFVPLTLILPLGLKLLHPIEILYLQPFSNLAWHENYFLDKYLVSRTILDFISSFAFLFLNYLTLYLVCVFAVKGEDMKDSPIISLFSNIRPKTFITGFMSLIFAKIAGMVIYFLPNNIAQFLDTYIFFPVADAIIICTILICINEQMKNDADNKKIGQDFLQNS